MKRLLFLSLILLSHEASAAKLVSHKIRQYFPVFGMGSTTSVVYTTAQGSVGFITPSDGAATELVRIYTTTAAYVDIGTNPAPTNASMPIPANTEMILEVLSGHKVGAVSSTGSGGNLFVTRLSFFPNND